MHNKQQDFALVAKHKSGKGFATKKAKNRALARQARQAYLEGPVVDEDEPET